MSDPRPPAAAASGTGGPRRRAWALLDRSPELLEPGKELPGGADYAITFDIPPKLSTVLVSRPPLIPPGDDIDAHIHCADGDGNLLLSVWGAGGHNSLLVCRAGSGRVDLLPAFPEHLAALEFGSDACWGINPAAADTGSGNYVVAKLQRAPGSSSSSSSREHHRALCYFSASQLWTIKDVVTEHPRHFEAHSDEEGGVTVEEVTADQAEQPVFEAHMVVSREKGSGLVFADLKHGVLLLLDPVEPSTARMVPFPASEDGEMPEAAADAMEAAARRCVSCAQGSLCVVEVNDRSVTMSTLEEQDQWVRRFRVPSRDIIWSDAPLGNRLALAAAAVELGVGPVDPTNRNCLSFFSPTGGVAFTVEVVFGPGEPSARFCDKVDANTGGSCLDVVVSTFDSAAPAAAAGARTSWKRTLTGGSKRIGRNVWRAVKIGRKHFDKLSPAAQAAVSFAASVGAPYAPTAARLVSAVVATNKVVEYGEDFITWWRRPRPRRQIDMVVATTEEAGQAIHEWIVNHKPAGMKVYPAPGVSCEQVIALKNFMIQEDAEELLPVPLDSDYEHVPPALHDFSSV